MSILCRLGFHSWLDAAMAWRVCERCRKAQYYSFGMERWLDDSPRVKGGRA